MLYNGRQTAKESNNDQNTTLSGGGLSFDFTVTVTTKQYDKDVTFWEATGSSNLFI